MPIVFEAMAFGPTGRKWQDWVQPIEGLDSALLIDEKTAACRGGLRYKPIMSAAFSSNSGSSLAM